MDSTSNSSSTFFTNPWWAMGQPVEGQCGYCINETATRARAGLLNVLSGTTIFIMLAAPELDPIRFVAPFVISDMVAGATFGLTPFSPAGIFGTFFTREIRPVWKPTKHKRFAWTLGAVVSPSGCLAGRRGSLLYSASASF